MNTNQKVRFPLAPIPLVILMLTTLTSGIISVVKIIRMGNWYYHAPWWHITVAVVFTLVMLLLLLGTGVVLVLKNRSVILPAVLCGYFLYFLASFFKIVLFIRNDYYSFDGRAMIMLYCYGLLIFFVFVLSDQKLIKKDMTNLKALVAKAYYLPAAVCAASWIISGLQNLLSMIIYKSGFSAGILGGIDWIATIAFMFLLMMWLKAPFVKEKTPSNAKSTATTDSGEGYFTASIEEESTVQETPASEETDDSVYEQIRKYKAFLDAGLITQEDFDQKKKQLLGY